MAYTSVKISANSSDYQSQMKSAAAQMKVLSAEYTTAATKAKLFGSETDSLKAKAESLTQKITVQKGIVQLNSEQQEKLTKKLSEQKTKQEELKSKIDAAKDAYAKSTEETGKNSEQSKALKEELDKLEQEYKANETAMRYMDDMVILGKSKKKLHKIHAAIETYLNDNLDLEIKGDWQVFRFEYPVFDKGGNPVLDKDGKQVTKGRMLDFMGFQFHHDRTTIRKLNIEAARRKANHISKQDKISWYNASVMLSYMGLFKHTDTYNYYVEYIKPKINVKKLKRIVSKHSRKENEKHDRLEKGDRNTAGQAGGDRPDIVSVNGLSA